jgi:hypothetical protein
VYFRGHPAARGGLIFVGGSVIFVGGGVISNVGGFGGPRRTAGTSVAV